LSSTLSCDEDTIYLSSRLIAFIVLSCSALTYPSMSARYSSGTKKMYLARKGFLARCRKSRPRSLIMFLTSAVTPAFHALASVVSALPRRVFLYMPLLDNGTPSSSKDSSSSLILTSRFGNPRNYLSLAFRLFPGFGPVQILHPWMFPRVIVYAQGFQISRVVIAAILDKLFVMYVEYPC